MLKVKMKGTLEMFWRRRERNAKDSCAVLEGVSKKHAELDGRMKRLETGGTSAGVVIIGGKL